MSHNVAFNNFWFHTDCLSSEKQYMDKPPEGKHSTKGLGKKMPQESEYAKWRGDVTVPCGKPVPSNVKASELMYNEYIVYNTAQVSFKFGLFLSYNANEASTTCLNCKFQFCAEKLGFFILKFLVDDF